MRDRVLCFIVPAHGRLAIAEVCFRQLRRTCDALGRRGIVADAVVIADDENLDLAQACGFATVERENRGLGAKLNDGYQLAAEHGAEFFVPFGSDDWIDHEWIKLPRAGEITCTHLSSVVNATGRRLSRLNITYAGGDGVRVYPRRMLELCDFRPATEDGKRAMDAATNSAIMRGGAFKHVYRDIDPLAIVDFKSDANLNDYAGCHRKFGRHFEELRDADVWETLATTYPKEAIDEMKAVYEKMNHGVRMVPA